MRKPANVAGQRFGQMVAIKPSEKRYGRYCWLCECDCGRQTIVSVSSLLNGNTRSCGHLNGGNNLVHGCRRTGSSTPEYRTWRAMRERCRNPNNKHFKNYGGRGIKVCKRWDDFRNFLADMGPRPETYSIERIDNDGNYKPSNCKWIPLLDQSKNRRRGATRRRTT